MTLDVELHRPGRHHGALTVPWSRDSSAYGQLMVPLTVLQGAPGPTLLLIAGVHGDEYEGQIVLPELARTLDPASLHGRVILVPQANPPACAAGRRTSPVDGGNLARLFPGDPTGSLTSALAAAITRDLLSLADAVVDLHAGGASLEYIPCAWGRLPGDPVQAGRVLDLLLAFGAPLTAVTLQPSSPSTLVATALAAGRIAIAAELGGGASVTTASLACARQGCRNVMTHLRILEPPPPEDGEARTAPLRSLPSRLLAVGAEHFLRSPAAGLFEPRFQLGQEVLAGDEAGSLLAPDAGPRPLTFGAPGLVLCRRVPTPCEPGDVLAHLAQDTTREALLTR